MLFPFCCLKLEMFKVKKCFKNKSDVKVKSTAELQEQGVSCLNNWNFEREKTSDVGKYHNT